MLFLFYLYKNWKKHSLSRHAAAMSYYLFIGFISLSLLLSSLLQVFSSDFLEERTIQFTEQYLGEQVSQIIQLLIFSPSSNVLAASFLSLAILIISAGVGFSQLQASLDEIIYGYKKKNFLENIKNRLFSSFVLLLSTSVFLLFVLVSSFLAIVVRAGFEILNIPSFLFSLTSFAFIFLIMTLFLTFLFQYLPTSKRPWRGVFKASMLSSFLFLIGKYLFETYFAYSNLAGLPGITSHIIIFLLWLYYTSISILIGSVYIKYKTPTGH